jgi:D-ribose pyranase
MCVEASRRCSPVKRTGILNRDLSALIAGLGHTDLFCIADAGLPIPAGVQRIDLALVCGIPSFLETLNAVLAEVVVEHAAIAIEMAARNPTGYRVLRDTLGGITLEEVTHEDLKARLTAARAVIRTGECTPYSNVLLRSGVAY